MRIGIAICFLLGLTQASTATPERYVDMREQVLGQTDTQFFVLRHIRDNLGYHETLRDEFYLIARDLLTGDEERIWPVMRSLDHGRYYFQNNAPERFENLGAGERVNPYDILLWRKAYNLHPTIYPPDAYGLRVSVTGSDILVTEEGSSTESPAVPLLARLTESLEHTRRILPGDGLDRPWLQEISWKVGRLRNEEGAFASGCEIGGRVYVEKPLVSDLRPVLARLDCHNQDEETGGIFYWMVLSPQRDSDSPLPAADE